MIISHKYKYAFVELNLSASTTLSRELLECYAGTRVMKRHATYDDFLRIASDEEKEYFTFSTIRNPLDLAVTQYHKYKSNHRGQFTNPERWKKYDGSIYYNLIAKRRYDFVTDAGMTFADYFKRFYKLPYDNWSSLSHKDFDYVVRFENLEEGFAHVLALLGIEQVRPLPQVNKTRGRESDYLE